MKQQRPVILLRVNDPKNLYLIIINLRDSAWLAHYCCWVWRLPSRHGPGVPGTCGEVWGVNLQDIHGIDDPRFHFVLADAAHVADRWKAIDFLRIDTDPHTEEQTRRWFELYAHRCRAIALHDTHHPSFGVGVAVRRFVEEGEWRVFEYWGNPSGPTVLTRVGEPCPEVAEGR
jgi:hypothetical protein